MCGIAGIINFDEPENMMAPLRRMIGLMRHRGPDAAGVYLNGPAGLAHARLSIIDLSGGDQPIYNEDRTAWIVFNGEIFNYPELRADLVASGHRFYTNSDTEVLIHLYEERGVDMFKALNGQFAFAVWDGRRQTLLLARDRMGIRPLFYRQEKRRLMFASEIKALFADPGTRRALDLQTLSDVFTCWSALGAFTPFENVFQLPPAHYALFSREGMQVHPYWKLSFSDPSPWEHSISEYAEELNGLLYDAARIRLRADVPVGAYLSGGLDSTYISSLVKREFDNPLNTFSVSFCDERYDETSFQTMAVDALETEHRTINCAGDDIGELFPRIVWHAETPLLRTGPAPLHRLSKLVRECGFKVVLTGEGADEIFAGYNIFKEDKVRRFWARDPESEMRPRLLEKLYPYIFLPGNEKAAAFRKGFFKRNLAGMDAPDYSHRLRWDNTSRLRAFFSREALEEIETREPFTDRFTAMLPPDFMSWDPLSRAQFTEISIFLPNYLLSSQGDRMAMANSIEGRFPFLDHRVVEFASRVPSRFRMNGLTEKYILRKAAAGAMPPELAQRPKQPYRAPVSECFRAVGLDYVEDLLGESAIRRAGYFDPARVSKLKAKWTRQNGSLAGEWESMALIGILSTQLLDHQFIREFPSYPVREPEDMLVFRE
ncbi:MAG: asparagine synthase (glutamine-hydrolyzing) [Desulfobacterales bacterium]|nr:asparagine synthase (glutamine-hydrolyzing) [Desulfobacterales bacterium]